MTRYTMKLNPECSGEYPEALLREWAAATLGAERCSTDYLKALRIVLGNMARADRHGSRLRLAPMVPCAFGETPFATRQTMRTILGQLVAAGLVTYKEYAKRSEYTYEGRVHRDDSLADQDPYSGLLREAEEMAFRRYRESLGICVADVPH